VFRPRVASATAASTPRLAASARCYHLTSASARASFNEEGLLFGLQRVLDGIEVLVRSRSGQRAELAQD
jgi:hypothetical protein